MTYESIPTVTYYHGQSLVIFVTVAFFNIVRHNTSRLVQLRDLDLLAVLFEFLHDVCAELVLKFGTQEVYLRALRS